MDLLKKKIDCETLLDLKTCLIFEEITTKWSLFCFKAHSVILMERRKVLIRCCPTLCLSPKYLGEM